MVAAAFHYSTVRMIQKMSRRSTILTNESEVDGLSLNGRRSDSNTAGYCLHCWHTGHVTLIDRASRRVAAQAPTAQVVAFAY